MPFSAGTKSKPSLGVFRMALALVVAAFLGGSLGLVWQTASRITADDPDEEVVTQEAPEVPEVPTSG